MLTFFYFFPDFDRLSNPTVARISVKERSSHIILPPKISCEPKPNYIWSKDGKIITESNNVKNDIRISADGGLYISNIGLSAQGTYKLKIENTFMATKNMQYASQDALEIVLTVISSKYLPFFKYFMLVISDNL